MRARCRLPWRGAAPAGMRTCGRGHCLVPPVQQLSAREPALAPRRAQVPAGLRRPPVPGRAGFAAGASAGLGAGAAPEPAAFTSSPSPASTAMMSLTGTSWVPSGTRILAMVPSSTASTSIVALSVSISAITSPDLTLSPSFLSHLARLPFSIVGDSAGMRILIGIVSDLVATVAWWCRRRSAARFQLRTC